MEKDIYSPASMPCSSQVLELTMPMDAVAEAPIWPTMAASMYSMAVTTICCRMDGMLKCQHDLGRLLQRYLLALPHFGRELFKGNGHGSSFKVRIADDESNHLL